MRKLIALALLAGFGLPFASSLLALMPPSEGNLSACCRRNGAHHCAMSGAERAELASGEAAWTAPERCPLAPCAAMPDGNGDAMGVIPGSAAFAGLVRDGAFDAPAPAQWRMKHDRSHQKRGPPAA